jgi:hypothetical protein
MPVTAPKTVNGMWCLNSVIMRWNMFILGLYLCFRRLLAALAESGELEQVVVNTKAALVAEPCLKSREAGLDDTYAREVNYLAAAGAYQVMVVLWCASSVAGAIIAGMEFAYKLQFHQQLQGAVDGYQTDAGVVAADLPKYCSGSEMVLAGGKGVYYRSSLWSELVTMSFEDGDNTSIGEFHPIC